MVRFGELILRSPDRNDGRAANNRPPVRDYSGGLHTAARRTGIEIKLTFSFLPDSQVVGLQKHYAECSAPFIYTDYSGSEASDSGSSSSGGKEFLVVYTSPLEIVWDKLRGGASVSINLRRV